MRSVSALTILLLVGIVVRLGAGWLRPSDLKADNDGYLAHAEMVVQGEGFAGPFTHQPTAFRPPAYPIALAGLRSAGLNQTTSVAIINGFCSIAIIWLTWQLGQQLGLPDVVTLFATAITSLDPLLVRYSILPMTEVPAAALLLAAIVALKAGEQKFPHVGGKGANPLVRLSASVASRDERDGIGMHHTKHVVPCQSTAIGLWLVSGILFGMGSLVRPIIFVTCAMLVFTRVVRSLRQPAEFRRRIMTAVVPAVAALLAISPWIMRNATQFHKFIPATTHGGYTLALGNNADFYRDVIDGETSFPWPGPQLDAWQKKMIVDAKAQGVSVGNEPELDAWYYRQAFAAIQRQPVSFIKACLLRLRRFWAITPGAGDTLPGVVTALTAVWYGIISIGVIAVISQSISACCRCGTRGSRECDSAGSGLADLWLAVLSFMLLHSVYWTDTRMRAPVMPLVCLLAASGWYSVFIKIFHRTVTKFSAESPT